MQTYRTSTKVQVIEQLHAVFNNDFLTMDEIMQEMQSIMDENGIRFNAPEQIPTDEFVMDIDDMASSFYCAVNSIACEQLPNFAVHCEAFLSFDEVIRRDNERNNAMGQKGDYIEFEEVKEPVYTVLAIAGNYHTLINPPSQAA